MDGTRDTEMTGESVRTHRVRGREKDSLDFRTLKGLWVRNRATFSRTMADSKEREREEEGG